MEERKHDDLTLFAGTVDSVDSRNTAGKLIDGTGSEHDGLALAGGAAAVQKNGDIIGITIRLHVGSFKTLNGGHIVFTVFDFRELLFHDILADFGAGGFHKVAVIGAVANDTGQAGLIDHINILFGKQVKDHNALGVTFLDRLFQCLGRKQRMYKINNNAYFIESIKCGNALHGGGHENSNNIAFGKTKLDSCVSGKSINIF